MTKPLNDEEFEELKKGRVCTATFNAHMFVTQKDFNRLVATVEYWREERNALSRKLNQSRLRREFLLEEENAKLKTELKGFIEGHGDDRQRPC